MPVKRRLGKRRSELPDAVQRLREPIEDTPEARDEIIGIAYFDDFPDELTAADRERGLDLLRQWREREGAARCR